MITDHTDPSALTCQCTDPEAAEVAAMIAHGMPVLSACRAMWGGGPEAVAFKVRAEFMAAFPWLRLPEVAA